MSNVPIRAFRAQLTTVMDSVLKSALIQVMNIFENTLQDHQLELAHKGEEIAHLRVKLQTLEVKMADGESGNKQGKYTAKTPMNQSQPEVDGVNPCEQTSDVPEIQFEVPDDWCAPLGCETTVKMDEAACPSVRLRQLYIPLSHVPLIKKEVEDYAIDSHKQKKKGRRRSGRISTLSENDKHSPGRGTPTTVPATNRQVKRKDMKILLRGIKQEYTDAARSPQRLVREVNRPKNTSVPAAECKDQEAVESKPEKIYYCSFCTEVFDAPSELSVHARSHMKCKVCKKQFSYPRAFLTHQRLCAKADDERASTARRTRAGALHRAATEGSKYIVASRLRSGSHSWTVPLEVHEDPADLTSSGAETDLGVDRNERETEHDRDAELHPTLEAMGTRCADGFICLLCPEVLSSESLLIKHFSTHTQEEPMKRDCGAGKLCSRAQRSKEKCTKPLIPCVKCCRKFSSQTKCNKHLHKSHGNWAHVCKVCGKGFILKGRLRNHVQLHV